MRGQSNRSSRFSNRQASNSHGSRGSSFDEPAGFHLFSGVEIPAVKYEYLGIVGTPERAQISTPVSSGGIGNNNQGNARPVSANYIRSLLKSAERPHSALAQRSTPRSSKSASQPRASSSLSQYDTTLPDVMENPLGRLEQDDSADTPHPASFYSSNFGAAQVTDNHAANQLNRFLRKNMKASQKTRCSLKPLWVSHVPENTPVDEEKIEGERLVYETWNELMLVIQKKTTDTPQTLRAKSEPFFDYLGPDVLESMGLPRENIILLYRLLLSHCSSFHSVVADVLRKRTPSAKFAHVGDGGEAESPFQKALKLFSDPEQLRQYPKSVCKAEFDEARTVRAVWRLYSLMWESAAGAESSPFQSHVTKTVQDLKQCMEREQDLELRLAELTAAHERLQREMRELGEAASKTQVELAGKDDHHRAYVETSELQYKRLEEKYALVQGTLQESRAAERRLTLELQHEKGAVKQLTQSLTRARIMLEDADLSLETEANQLAVDPNQRGTTKKKIYDKKAFNALEKELKNVKLQRSKLKTELEETHHDLTKEREIVCDQARKIDELKSQLKSREEKNSDLKKQMASVEEQHLRQQGDQRIQSRATEAELNRRLVDKEKEKQVAIDELSEKLEEALKRAIVAEHNTSLEMNGNSAKRLDIDKLRKQLHRTRLRASYARSQNSMLRSQVRETRIRARRAREKSEANLISALATLDKLSNRIGTLEQRTSQPREGRATEDSVAPHEFSLAALDDIQVTIESLEQWIGSEGAPRSELDDVSSILRHMDTIEQTFLLDIKQQWAGNEHHWEAKHAKAVAEAHEADEMKHALDLEYNKVLQSCADLKEQLHTAVQAVDNTRKTASTALAAAEVMELNPELLAANKGRSHVKATAARLELALAKLSAKRTLEHEDGKIRAQDQVLEWLRSAHNSDLDALAKRVQDANLLVPTPPLPGSIAVELGEEYQHAQIAPVMLLERQPRCECRYATTQTDPPDVLKSASPSKTLTSSGPPPSPNITASTGTPLEKRRGRSARAERGPSRIISHNIRDPPEDAYATPTQYHRGNSPERTPFSGRRSPLPRHLF